MSDEIRKQTFILAKRKTILLVYLLLVCIKTLHAIVTSKYIGENLFVLVVYGVLVALIYRGNKIANWIMILLILLSGVGSSLIGIALVPFKQYVVKTFLTVIGLYFIYGGLRLIAIERSGQNGS
jgi:hypothetical protein